MTLKDSVQYLRTLGYTVTCEGQWVEGSDDCGLIFAVTKNNKRIVIDEPGVRYLAQQLRSTQ